MLSSLYLVFFKWLSVSVLHFCMSPITDVSEHLIFLNIFMFLTIALLGIEGLLSPFHRMDLSTEGDCSHVGHLL